MIKYIHYELPIDMVASSRKNKSRQGITIRNNKQPASIVQSSNVHLNRTESSHSSNSKRAPNMIPWFPANMITDSSQEDYTDKHPCGIASNRSSTLHITEDNPPNTSQVRTRSTTKKLNHCLENQKGYYLSNRKYREMLMLQFITGRLIRFWSLVK